MNSGQETEAKFYVKDLSKITARLKELKASLAQPRVHEVNLRFDTPNDDLRRAKQVLRLRRDDQAHMTFKGPAEKKGGVMSREEIEFVVDDFERAKQFIEALGYQQIAFYEKYRTTYDLDGHHIMLDELPYGDFLEIEGEEIESIHGIADKLGLRWETAIEASYLALFERLAGKHRIEKGTLSFDAFKGWKPTALDMQIVEAD